MSKYNLDIFVVSCMIFDKEKEKLLILKRGDYRPNLKDLWCFPGGGVEVGEDVNDAIKRETMEEANIQLNNLSLIKINSGTSKIDGRNFIFIIYYSDDFTLIENKIKLSDEHVDFKWVSLIEFGNYKLTPGLQISFNDIMEYLKLKK